MSVARLAASQRLQLLGGAVETRVVGDQHVGAGRRDQVTGSCCRTSANAGRLTTSTGGSVAVRPSRVVVGCLAVGTGLSHGYLNGTAMTAGSGLLCLVGIAAAVFVSVTLLTAFVVSLEAPWARVAVRVSGSWVVAVGLLMLGWSFRGAAS